MINTDRKQFTHEELKRALKDFKTTKLDETDLKVNKITNPVFPEFLKWAFLSLNFGHIYCFSEGFESKISNRMANSVDSDELAHYEPSQLDLNCLQRYHYWSAGLKELRVDTLSK